MPEDQFDTSTQQQIGAMVNDAVTRHIGELTIGKFHAEATSAALRHQLSQAQAPAPEPA